MADEVRLTIRASGGLLAERMLHQVMREEGVQVLSTTGGGEESRGIEWSADIQQAVVSLVVLGAGPAVRAAAARFRRKFPTATMEVKDEGGKTPPGYL